MDPLSLTFLSVPCSCCASAGSAVAHSARSSSVAVALSVAVNVMGRRPFRWCGSPGFGGAGRRWRLAAGLGNGHHLQQVPGRILEVEAAPAAPPVDPAVVGLVGLAAVGEAAGLHAAEDRLVLGVAHVECVVLA